MALSKKRKALELSDSDDSDDELLARASISRSSKRRQALDEAARKKERMEKMQQLLKNGKKNLERENRMGKLCQENNDVMRKESLDEKENEKNDDGDKSDKGAASVEESKSAIFQYYEPKNSRATNCLGSRITLQFSREVSFPSTSDDACDFTPYWFGLDEALTDLRTILAADRQNQQDPSTFTTLREELLRLCESKNSARAFRSYLMKALMSKNDKDKVARIHVDVLRWMMALACGPVMNGYINVGDNDETKPATTQKKQSKKKQAALKGNDNPLLSRRLLMDAQMGAYQTLSRLWSQDLGFPLQEDQGAGIYLLSIRALPQQLRQWFGSSFSFESATADSSKNNEAKDESKNIKTIRSTNSHTTLVRFLELWALVLQKQNDSDTAKGNAYLVQFHCDKSRAKFRSDISDAILAVLWAGLHPSFASSISAKNDGNRAMQTIVACLLDRVRREDIYFKNKSGGGGDNVESYGQWIENLSENLFTTWSKYLGRGRAGTDAHEDEHAWLSLARSVARLIRIGGGDYYQKGSDSSASLESYPRRESSIPASLRDFQLSLCRCLLMRAFDAEQDGQEIQHTENALEGKPINTIDEKSNDWLSSLIANEIELMKVPVEIQSSHRWRAMSLAVAGMVKLAGSFPEEEASKCFALMDICTVCFHSTIVELEHEVLKNCLNEKKDRFDEDEDDDSPMTDDNNVNDEPLEKYALYNALVRLEQASQIISSRTKSLIMRNVCFPWAGHLADSLRNYARSRKERYAPPSLTNKVPSVKQQSSINTFFQNTKSSSEGITH